MGAEFSVGSGMWAPAVEVFDGDLEAISAMWPVPGLFGFYFWGGGADFPLPRCLGYPRACVGGAYTSSLRPLFFSLTCLSFLLRGYLLKLRVGDIARAAVIKEEASGRIPQP